VAAKLLDPDASGKLAANAGGGDLPGMWAGRANTSNMW